MNTRLARNPQNRRNHRLQHGFTVLEATIAILLSMVMLLVAFKEFLEMARIHHSQSQVAEMRQNARNLVEFLTRDMLSSGYGMTTTSMDPVIPNEPTVLGTFSSTIVTVRHNATDVWSSVDVDMALASSNVEVVTTDGFEDGQRVAIWDNTGTWEWWTITAVVNGTTLSHTTDLTQVYTKTTTEARVVALKEVTFRYLAGDEIVQRMEDDGAWTTIARNITALTFHYWDEDGVEIFPNDFASREQIRQVSVDVTARTDETDRVSGLFQNYSISTTITPRNLLANRI